MRKTARNRRKTRTALVMIIPALLFLVSLKGYPLLKVIHDSFFQVSLIKPGEGFAGLENFGVIMADERFGQTICNTICYTVFSVLGEYLAGMATAVLLNREFKGRSVFRTLIFIPWLVPIIVAGMTWDWMLNTEFGVVNYALQNLHITDAPIDFLGRFQVCHGDGGADQYMEIFSVLHHFLFICHAGNLRGSFGSCSHRRGRLG